MQEVSGVYTSSFFDADELKVALRARKFPGLSGNGRLDSTSFKLCSSL